MPELLTVGHGNLALDVLIGNLRGAGVGRLVDVRSTPYSRWCSQFNRKSIEAASKAAGIAYEPAPANQSSGERPVTVHARITISAAARASSPALWCLNTTPR